MKILHVVPSYKPAYVYGGPIESVAKLCEGLASEGNTVHVFTTTANGKKELDVLPDKTVHVDGVQVTYFRRITKDHTHISITLWKRLFQECKNYDIIHIHSWWSPLVMIAALLLHMRKAKVVIAPRGMISNYIINTSNSTIKKILHTTIGKRALSKSFFHATAQSEMDECKDLIKGWKGFLLPNILTLPPIDIVRKPNNVFTLIFLSRIHPKKGIELLLEALVGMPIQVVLKIAGTGEDGYVDELKSKAKHLGVAEKVDWVGWKSREEKFYELMNSDLFVLTSYNENFANVVIESLHVGTPVLISEEVGLSSYIKSNDLGWITRLNVEDIRKGILEAYQDNMKRIRISQIARQEIEKSFSENILIKKYIENYKSLINL